VHTFLPLSPCPQLLLSSPSQFQAGPVLPLSLILLKKRHKKHKRKEKKRHKEHKAFLLLELRIAIKDIPDIAFVYTCVITHVDSSLSDLYPGS
jgi:hypothetical protein